MTTIAYRNGVMAADTRAMVDNWIMPWPCVKIRRLKAGGLVGFAGNPYLFGPLLACLSGQGADIDLKDDSVALLVRSDGTIFKLAHEGQIKIDAEYAAIGSGAPAALAAMLMGAEPEKAVAIAAELDPWTGGKIQVERLEVAHEGVISDTPAKAVGELL